MRRNVKCRSDVLGSMKVEESLVNEPVSRRRAEEVVVEAG